MEICAFVEPQQGASYTELRDFAVSAERLGFHGFFRSDHYLKMGEATDGAPGPTDAWTSLAAIAVETSTVRLGTLVSSVTYRTPGILAVQVANVDDISGGRVELGLGTGWFEAEHRAYGIPFPEKRFGMLEEQLEIVRGLWSISGDETFDFSGEHYQLEGAPARQRPVQDSVPIIVGGGGPTRTPRIAARYASEFNSFSGPTGAGDRFDVVRAACETEGRDPESLRYSAVAQVWCGRSAEERATRAEKVGGNLENPDNAVGSPQQIVDILAAYAERGAARVYLQFFDLRDLEHLELVGTEVLPHVA
ncbi:MAG: LLM class F420-dependent oxidoreductase [Leifsonia sp.]|nr:LLM class F420-dependent oxidoreductase [Leifsonia sp.]|tara:strand:+ start:53020 stop:53937 length:918 start_codon:yes stop_codon:yes gene_type:complete